jgi:hypothetical protein
MTPSNEQAFIEWLQEQYSQAEERRNKHIKFSTSYEVYTSYMDAFDSAKEKFISITNRTLPDGRKK